MASKKQATTAEVQGGISGKAYITTRRRLSGASTKDGRNVQSSTVTRPIQYGEGE